MPSSKTDKKKKDKTKRFKLTIEMVKDLKKSLIDELVSANENLTSVQVRCSELKLENRSLRKEIEDLKGQLKETRAAAPVVVGSQNVDADNTKPGLEANDQSKTDVPMLPESAVKSPHKQPPFRHARFDDPREMVLDGASNRFPRYRGFDKKTRYD